MLTIDHIRNLMDTASDEVLSLYLHVDPAHQANQNEPRAWEIYAKNALREIEKKQDKEAVDWDAIREHTDTFLDGYMPKSKSLILFVDEEGVIEHFEVPVVIENEHAFGSMNVVPLIWAMDEYERYLVVLVDSQQARFLSAYLGVASSNDEMSLDFDDYDFGNKRFIHANHSAGAEGLQGSGGDNFEDMKAAHIRRFHGDVAAHIREVIQDMRSERLILGGSEQAAHQVKDLLHESVRNQLLDILSIPITSSESEVAAQIQSAALNYERSKELDLVNQIIDMAKAGGRGALGADVIEDLLKMQQVDLLVLPYPMEDEEQARQFTTMAMRSGAEIELVHGSAADRLNEEGNVAARLYYVIPEA